MDRVRCHLRAVPATCVAGSMYWITCALLSSFLQVMATERPLYGIVVFDPVPTAAGHGTVLGRPNPRPPGGSSGKRWILAEYYEWAMDAHAQQNRPIQPHPIRRYLAVMLNVVFPLDDPSRPDSVRAMGTVRRLAPAAGPVASLLRLQYLTLVRVEYLRYYALSGRITL
jgi:hypothetical protein